MKTAAKDSRVYQLADSLTDEQLEIELSGATGLYRDTVRKALGRRTERALTVTPYGARLQVARKILSRKAHARASPSSSRSKAHPLKGRFWIAPTADPRDRYAAGYEGNHFRTRLEAQRAIASLRALGGDFDVPWVINED